MKYSAHFQTAQTGKVYSSNLLRVGCFQTVQLLQCIQEKCTAVHRDIFSNCSLISSRRHLCCKLCRQLCYTLAHTHLHRQLCCTLGQRHRQLSCHHHWVPNKQTTNWEKWIGETQAKSVSSLYSLTSSSTPSSSSPTNLFSATESFKWGVNVNKT